MMSGIYLKILQQRKKRERKKGNLRKYGKLFIIVGTSSSIYGELFYLSLYFYTRWKISIIKEFLSSVFSRVWLCNPLDCSLPVSSVLGIFQARILEQVAISYSWESFQPRDRAHMSCSGEGPLYHCATWEALATPLLVIFIIDISWQSVMTEFLNFPQYSFYPLF